MEIIRIKKTPTGQIILLCRDVFCVSYKKVGSGLLTNCIYRV
nr:MAG TPA: hypothetical protein [Caudoviricetes sp.]